jgi:hypothetical protein
MRKLPATNCFGYAPTAGIAISEQEHGYRTYGIEDKTANDTCSSWRK